MQLRKEDHIQSPESCTLGFLFLSDDKTAIRFFVIAFLIYYFIILIYDTAYFVKVEKTIQQNG